MVELVNLISAFTYGLTSSLTLCLASCLPVYLPLLFGYAEDHKKGLKISIGFGIGRFIGYFFLGILAAIMGATFIYFFKDTFPKISIWIVFFFGLLTIFYGTLILAKVNFMILKEQSCKNYMNKTKSLNRPGIGAGIPGFVSTVTPCVPVFTFLLLPFALGNIWETSFITIAFGLGANLIFIVLSIFVVLGIKNLKEKFALWKRKLELFSGIILIVFGLFYLIWAMGPLFFNWTYLNYTLPTIFDFINFIKYFLLK